MTIRNTFIKIWCALSVAMAFVMHIEAQAPVGNLSDAQKRELILRKASTPSDSIKILLEAYNLSSKENRDRLRVQIMDVMQRSDNNEVVSNVLRELATSTDDTRDLSRLIELSSYLPEGENRNSVQTILEMEHATKQASKTGDSVSSGDVAEYARQGLSIGGDPYKEIQNIYRAMVFLGASSQGPLYLEYMKRLEELVDALPEKDHAIRNLFYTNAALYYTRKRDYEKALYFDRKLIKELDAINNHYIERGDTTHNLDYFYYVSYRRMLRNFKGLTPQEIEDYYSKCLQLAEEDEQVAKEFGNGGLTKSYYYMATQQYAKAIPELHKALESNDISKYRKRELLGHLALAFRETGNEKGELEALRPYTLLLLDDREERMADMYKEIELRNSVSKLINDEVIAQQQQRQENSVMRKTAITLVYVLAVLLIFIAQAYFRLRQKVKLLEKNNSRLHKNIEYIFDDGVPKGTQNLRLQKNRLKG